jgi:hypothetical protein
MFFLLTLQSLVDSSHDRQDKTRNAGGPSDDIPNTTMISTQLPCRLYCMYTRSYTYSMYDRYQVPACSFSFAQNLQRQKAKIDSLYLCLRLRLRLGGVKPRCM